MCVIHFNKNLTKNPQLQWLHIQQRAKSVCLQSKGTRLAPAASLPFSVGCFLFCTCVFWCVAPLLLCFCCSVVTHCPFLFLTFPPSSSAPMLICSVPCLSTPQPATLILCGKICQVSQNKCSRGTCLEQNYSDKSSHRPLSNLQMGWNSQQLSAA